MSATYACRIVPLSSSFHSVDEFLRRIREAKASQRHSVEQFVSEHFEDPHLVAVPPELGEQINDYVEAYGDEALRQISLFAMGKWFAIHTAYIQELVANDNVQSVVATTMEASRISQCITTLETVGSFSGHDSWREMVKTLAIGHINDEMNHDESN